MQADAGAPVRWGGALAIVVAAHGMAAWMLLNHAIPPMMMPAAPEAVMLDLAPDLPPVQPAELPLPVPIVETPPPMAPPTPPEVPIPPRPVPETPPADTPPPPVEAEAVLPVPPPPPPPRAQPRPKVRAVERQAVPVARSAEAHPTEVPQAPRMVEPTRTPAPASTVTPSWRSDLLARLQRAKRYPDLARSHGDQGVAKVTFTMDRGGRVLTVSLVGSSSSSLLDDEAVALVRRAEPLPPLPEEMPGGTITLTVPISFALR